MKKNTINTIHGNLVENTDTPIVNGSHCHEYCGCLTKNGYGQISLKGTTVQIHRALYIEKHGEIQGKLEVNHICNNRKCGNVDHLNLLSHRDNVIHSFQTNKHNRKKKVVLTKAQIKHIYHNERHESREFLMKKYNVSSCTIRRIFNGSRKVG